MTRSNLTLGSLFDGSGGFPLGGLLCGITPVWASEIEPFAVRVTTKRLPDMKHYGDVSAMDGGRIEPVDIITFGSPCQDMSIAGHREGLEGERSGLFHQAIRVIKEMRLATNGRDPRFVVWENVPGAFSSNKGEDFRAVLEAVCGIKDEKVHIPVPRDGRWQPAGEIVGDGFSVAWRVLDAQYWGVPQRRKRIYLVADLDSERAGAILFESEGLSGYTPQGFRAWQGTAGGAPDRSGDAGDVCLNDQGGRAMSVTDGVAATLRAETHGHAPCVLASQMYENHSQDTRFTGPVDTAPTVSATYGTGGNNQPFVVTPKTLKIRCGCEGGGKGPLIQDDLSATLSTHNDQTLFVPKCYGVCSKSSNAMLSDNPKSGFYEAETTRTLDTRGGDPSCNQGGMVVVEGNGSRPSHQGDGYAEADVSYTLNATEQHGVAYSMNKGSHFTNAIREKAGTLVATDYKDPPLVSRPRYVVRRLTPTECARLQGFPDWWTDDLGTDEPTGEEVEWWSGVFETHRQVVTHAKKPKTKNQIIKWLKDPYKDSAAYKMWGNGVALPCVHFVLAGIVYYAQFSGGEEAGNSTSD